MRSLCFCTLITLLSFFQIPSAFSTIRYVKAGATGNGSSWTSASGDIQAMINLSSEGDHIWVAAGTYIPNRQINNLSMITPGNRNNAFVISGNIQIYGGFAGYETTLDERDFKNNLTILSGKTENINFYHVLVFMNGSEAILDGFTIEGGKADGNEFVLTNGKEFKQDAGGGIYIMHSSPMLNQVIIKGNSAVYGGGIYCFHSFPLFTNVVVCHNSANSGGGVYNYYSFPVITNTTVSQNSGGGFFNAVSKPELFNSVVWDNGNNLHNDVYSQTDYSYSLVQNEISDTDYLNTENGTPEEEEAAGMYFYVSPDGNDGDTGTKKQPLATLAGARNKIREIKASTGLPAGGIVVYFREGTYPVTETTYLTDLDSGTENSLITYKAYPGEVPVFTGGLYIKGSLFGEVKDAVMRERLLPEAKEKVVCYDLFANGLSFDNLDYSKDFWKQDNLKEHESEEFHINNYYVRRMQVFMDDDALYLARYPNKTAGTFPENPYNTYLSIAEIYGGRGVVGFEGEEAWDGKAPVFRINEPRIRNWRNHEDIIVFGMTGVYYENERNLVKTIDAGSMTIELQSMPTYGLFDDGRIAFENVFEELDRPGEYYIDKSTGMLYLYPTKDLKDATIKISLLDRNFMIDVKDASYVTFSGITFELTKGSVFYIRGRRNCTVENCNLKNFGIWGVRLGESALTPATAVEGWNLGRLDEYVNMTPAAANGYDHRISGCNFLNTGHHACRIASGSGSGRESGRMVFENNVIKYSGILGSTYRSGIEIQGVGISVKNNSFLYCLGQAICGNAIDTEITQNEFCDSPCDMAEDTGTIYLNYLNFNDGVKIRYNFFHDVTNADNRFGLYAGHAHRGAYAYDNNAPFKDFSYNMVYNYPTTGGLSVSSPSTNIGNIFVDCIEALPYQLQAFEEYEVKTAMDVLTQGGQSVISTHYKSDIWKTALWKEKYPEWNEYFEYMVNEKADMMQPMDQIYNNLIVNSNVSYHNLESHRIPQQVPVDPKYGKITNNHFISYDPGFPSIANRNFQLPEDVARRFGMDWIDMSRIGSAKAKQNRSALPVTSVLVHNDTELKEALDDGSIDVIIFANDITVNRSDLIIRSKRVKPDLVIDGSGHTLTEFAVNNYDYSKALRLENKGSIHSITVHNLNINGRNGAGNICIETAEKVELVYRNISYKGPKLAENKSGSILLENCDIRISFAEGEGTYMGEALKANHIRFYNNVNIQKDYDADGTMDAIIKLTGSAPSLIVGAYPRITEVMIEYAGKEIEQDRFIGGGGCIHADNPFDFIIETNSAIRYRGFYEYMTGAKVKRITEAWNSALGILLQEDMQRGVTDKVLSVAGDVIVGSASSLDIEAHAPLQCLLEVGGHFHANKGSYVWLSGYKFDPNSPEMPTVKYPVLLMKGGINSTVVFDCPTELFIQSQQTSQDWMRSIGFLEDGVIKFTTQQFAVTGRTPGSEEVLYEAENNGFMTVEAQVKGGSDGFTQSLSLQTKNDSPVNGGVINEESVNIKNTTRFFLSNDREQLGLNSGDYTIQNDAFTEPEIDRPSIGNISTNEDPLFQNASAGDFRLKAESPLIDAGNNQSYSDIISLYLSDSQKNSVNSRIIGGIIDIGAYEYDPSETGINHVAGLSDDIVTWTHQGKLYIRSEKPVRISIYSVSGLLIGKSDLKAYETTVFDLNKGIYIITSDNGYSRKIIVW